VKQQLILIRGLPGSGKTTLAELLAEPLNACHFEADHYFEEEDKENHEKTVYNFDPTKLKEAHESCQNWCRSALAAGRSVIISNTFSRIRELQPYLDMAVEFGVNPQVILKEGNYGSIHKVPEATIQRMKDRWEMYLPPYGWTSTGA